LAEVLLITGPQIRRVSAAKERVMLYYALVFLLVGLIAAALGVSGVAAVATQISWILFVIAVVLFLVHFISGRRGSVV
jgi:uncharacterized membrane protein YtjA (UPF0391 family)